MLTKNFFKTLSVLAVVLGSVSAHAMSLDWSGGYRFEWVDVDRPTLDSPYGTKMYGLNYLYLSPKIIATDGLNIITRFDILNSQQYPASQVGEIWGWDSTSGGGTTTGDQGSVNVRTSQLYLNYNQEFGQLTVGRAPFDFGIGMTFNSGKGLFDHWYDTKDIVSY